MDNAHSSNPAPEVDTSPPGRGRGTLLLIFAMFLAPVLVAVFLNSQFSDWRPGSTRNYGQLVIPVIPLADQLPVRAGAEGLPPWRLLWLREETCDAACSAQLDELERTRQTLGRHRDKLQVEVLAGDEAGAEPLRSTLATRGLSLDSLFLIDPLGNLMMAYPQPVDSTGLRKDLDRLIRHSKFKQDR